MLARYHFVFCHGFALTGVYWQNILPYFSGQKVSLVELGYFGKMQEIKVTPGEVLVAIGHSLGLINLLSRGYKFDYYIGINSFISFCGLNPKLKRERLRELNVMRRQFKLNPKQCLLNFYARAGISPKQQNIDCQGINKEQIDNSFMLLQQDHELPSIPSLIIAAEDDVIVPPAIINDNFRNVPQVKIEFLQNGGHNLPLSSCEVVAQKIMSFLHEA